MQQGWETLKFSQLDPALERHQSLYRELVTSGIRPGLAKSAIADLIAIGTKCCGGGEEKLRCSFHALAWIYAQSIARLSERESVDA